MRVQGRDDFREIEGITAFIDKANQPSSSWNVRNFGYFGGKASISYLTATSAADVVSWTNRQLFGNPNAGGVRCGTREAVIALRNCTIQGAPGSFDGCVQSSGCFAGSVR